jgi:hypothetical protein
MQPIDPKQLERVVGGAGGAILGSLLQNAGPIMNGVAGIIGAAKGGGGGGGGGGGAAAAGPPPGAQMAPAPAAGGGGGDPMVSVSVSINGVRQA